MVLMLMAVVLKPGDKVYGALALASLLISAFYRAVQMGQLQPPNVAEYGLTSYLKENSQTFGYSGYWTSNIITYLSGEEVTNRPVLFYRDGLRPNVWFGCERWYQSPPDNAFILVDNSTLDDNGRQVIGSLAQALNASEPLYYGNYVIYPTHCQAFRA